MSRPTCFISAGEISGDDHGAALINACEETIDFFGIAGPAMRQQKIAPIAPMEALQVMGITKVLMALPRLYFLMRRVEQEILARQPDIVLTIDYPGWHMALVRRLRKKGYKGRCIQWICPSFWAWGPTRVEKLKQSYDAVAAIYPFEVPLLCKEGVNAHYVGTYKAWMLKKALENPPVWTPQPESVALFPGSRPAEIQTHLATFLHLMKLTGDKRPIYISVAHPHLRPLILEIVEEEEMTECVELVAKEATYDLMRGISAALAVSGTITLELALMHVPTLIAYRIGTLTSAVARWILRVNHPYYALPNILSQKLIFIEAIYPRLNAHNLYPLWQQTLYNTTYRQKCRTHTQHLFEQLATVDPIASMRQLVETCL